MAEDNWWEGGGPARVGDMRRAALVIGYGDSDVHARIASNWSDGRGVKICQGWRSIRWLSVTVAARGQQDGETAPAMMRPS